MSVAEGLNVRTLQIPNNQRWFEC